jgi:histidinol phosphatase-like PHP family hydrolase
MSPDVYRHALHGGHWQAFAITDHAFALALPDDQPWPFQWYHQPERLWEHRSFREDKTARYLHRLAQICDSERLFRGLEVEVACDGSLSMDSLLWPHLEVVVGSIHYLPGNRATWIDAHLMQLNMLLDYPIDILGHPFREISRAGPVPDEIIDETLLRAQAAGVAVAINAHMPFERDVQVLARAVALGVQVAFGLDAHKREELEQHTYFAQIVAVSGVNIGDIRLFRPARNCHQETRNSLLGSER